MVLGTFDMQLSTILIKEIKTIKITHAIVQQGNKWCNSCIFHYNIYLNREFIPHESQILLNKKNLFLFFLHDRHYMFYMMTYENITEMSEAYKLLNEEVCYGKNVIIHSSKIITVS
jgi:hypothetical protein